MIYSAVAPRRDLVFRLIGLEPVGTYWIQALSPVLKTSITAYSGPMLDTDLPLISDL